MGATLPMDILVDEILTRTSPETVARSRAVCKHLNKATYEWSFMENLHRRTKTVAGIVVQTDFLGKTRHGFFSPVDPTRALSVMPFGKIEAATKQGLVLCKLYGSNFHLIMKPTTHQWQVIPSPDTRFKPLKFFMTALSSNPKMSRYKIVSMADLFAYGFRCEVFDSATWVWRTIPVGNIKFPISDKVQYDKLAVSVGRFVYVLTLDHKVFAFDWENESWDDGMALPVTLIAQQPTLLECAGKLIVVFMTRRCTFMELWVLERVGDNGVKAWNIKNRVNIECLNLGCHIHVEALVMPSSDVLILMADCNFKFLRLGSGDSSKNHVAKIMDYNVCGHDIRKQFWSEFEFEKTCKDKYIFREFGEVFWIESDEQFIELNMKKRYRWPWLKAIKAAT